MRAKRLLYECICYSERLSKCSLPSRWLWTLLWAKQDDQGCFPWIPTMVRNLVATTDWDEKTATKYLEELERVGLVRREEVWVTLYKGAELNGPPTSGSAGHRRPRYYQGWGLVSTE